MKRYLGLGFRLLLLPLLATTLTAAAPKVSPVPSEEFDPLGKAIVDLLQSGNAERFVDAACISDKDWSSESATPSNALKPPAGSSDRKHRALVLNAKKFVEKATALGLNFSNAPLSFHIAREPLPGTVFYGDRESGDPGWPFLAQLPFEITLADDASNVVERLRGKFTIQAQTLIRTLHIEETVARLLASQP